MHASGPFVASLYSYVLMATQQDYEPLSMYLFVVNLAGFSGLFTCI